MMKGIHGGDIYRNQVNIDFSVNTNPMGMPDNVKKALYKAIEKCNEYPDIEASKLMQDVSGALNIKKEYLLFGNGASEIFMGIVHGLRPKKVMIPVPSFFGYEYATKAVTSDIVYFQLNEEDEFSLKDNFIETLSNDIELIFLANPNNPTGKMTDKQYFVKIMDVCKEKNIMVVLDECFIEFCENETSMLSEIEKYENLILVRAFTKIYAIPGVRLGYLICSNQNILKKIKRQLPEWNLSTFAQEAGTACIRNTDYVKKTVQYIKKERTYLSCGLKKMGIRVYDSKTDFILIFTEYQLYEYLLKKGILIRNCDNFKGLSKGFYRIAVKTREENEKLLKEIGECIG